MTSGCHNDGALNTFVRGYCRERGWLWVPQAAQMPHANVLDLSVFPAMSKRHSRLLRQWRGKHSVATHAEIWAAAVEVWRQLPTPHIGRGFVLVMRLMPKVIKARGSNSFLRKNGLASGVRADFKSGGGGRIVRKDGKKF